MGVPKWECLSGSGPNLACLSGIRYGSACASKRVRAGVRSLLCTDHCSRRHARRRLPAQASSSGAIIPIRTLTHTHREAQRGAARHNNGISRADESNRAWHSRRGSGRASAMPCPGPPNGRTPSSPRPCMHSRGMALAWQAYRVGQWPPRPCIHSRRVSSARVIPWHFRFFFWFCSM